MTKSKIFIHWFRQDLRITDNPSLYSCAKQGLVFPIYIYDDQNSGEFEMGQGSRYFLYHSLQSLNKSLEGNLRVFKGDACKILEDIVSNHDVSAVQWNRCYEPWRLKRDKKIQKMLKEKKVDYQDFNGSLLWEPWEISKDDGTPYKVYTPYYKNGCLEAKAPQEPLESPENTEFFTGKVKNTIDLQKLKPSKEICNEYDKTKWKIGEKAALKKLDKFVQKRLDKYGKGRDYPAKKNVSRLSPHIHFGELSPHQVWYKVKSHKGSSKDKDKFKSELAWRDFAYYLLYHFPQITTENYQTKFDNYPWEKDSKKLKAWQEGQTGYPMVDASMRELNQTGYMHNRCRMIVASFLIKNLNIHWRDGEKYFWDRLMDADLASNSASWQWVAGCGLDAAPFFRIFNIVTQGSKFDPDGEFVYKYCPELKNLPVKYLFDPSSAPDKELKKANIKLGKDYPEAIVSLSETRDEALKHFKKITDDYHKKKDKK